MYIILGTNTNTDISMFRSVIDGLSDLDVEVLITIGFGSDPAPGGGSVRHRRPRSCGWRLAPPEVNPLTFRASMLALLNEPARWDGARRLQREIAAMPGPEEVVHLIEEVADVR